MTHYKEGMFGRWSPPPPPDRSIKSEPKEPPPHTCSTTDPVERRTEERFFRDFTANKRRTLSFSSNQTRDLEPEPISPEAAHARNTFEDMVVFLHEQSLAVEPPPLSQNPSEE